MDPQREATSKDGCNELSDANNGPTFTVNWLCALTVQSSDAALNETI